MASVFAFGPLAALTSATEGWRMSFTSVHFLLFLPFVVGAYFLVPPRFRRVWLLVASYYFYFFTAPAYFPVLLSGTVFTYIFACVIANAHTDNVRRLVQLIGVAGLLLGLAFFKYNDFFAPFVSRMLAGVGVAYNRDYFFAFEAIGISFYTFTAIGYLIDVGRGDVPAEKNIVNHALFLGFFGSVTMGPISRAGDLLPQLKDVSRRFDAVDAREALRGMAIGFFKKLAVADTLAVFTGAVYSDLAAYSGLTLTLAAVCFAVQLYFDFSGYTDIVLGAARLLGIRLPQNFKNPYFSMNFSSFWSRWHISLSLWLQDYIFTPLVWGRWTEKLPVLGKRVKNPPVLSSIFIVFLVSGIWHGDALCYVVWGVLQAMFRIGEELLHRFVGKPKKKPTLASRVGKTAVVLVLWVESLVFFRVGMPPAGSPGDAFSALVRQFSGGSLLQTGRDVYDAIFNGFFAKPVMVWLFLAFTLVCVAGAVWADWLECFRLRGKSLATALGSLRTAPRWLVYYALMLGCFAAFIAQSGGFAGAGFLYSGY